MRCMFCGEPRPDMTEMIFLNCEHIVCNEHIRLEAQRSFAETGTVRCPMQCGYILSRDELNSVVPQSELDLLLPSLPELIGDDLYTTCPCGIASVLVPGKVDYSYKDESGNPISREHADHMARYRLRCTCGRITCGKCHAEPYHIGKTCEEFSTFQHSKHCRYCGKAIKGSSLICKDTECIER